MVYGSRAGLSMWQVNRLDCLDEPFSLDNYSVTSDLELAVVVYR